MSDYAVGDRIGTATVLAVRGTKVPSLDAVDKPKQPEAKPITRPRGPRRPSAGEKAYAEFLTMAQAAGIVQFWAPEPWFLPLADDAKYRPDFFVVLASGQPCMVEIKGNFQWKGSFVKHKVARSLFPEYTWLCLEYKKGVWRIMFKTGREPLELLP
jgi:hypothetical protein